MPRHKLTQAEVRAYRELAKAARRLRRAQERAEMQRTREGIKTRSRPQGGHDEQA